MVLALGHLPGQGVHPAPETVLCTRLQQCLDFPTEVSVPKDSSPGHEGQARGASPRLSPPKAALPFSPADEEKLKEFNRALSLGLPEMF